jgi:hypothetical protein
VGKQLLQPACWLCGQALEDVLEVAIRIVSIELGGLDETHDVRGTLAGAKRSCEEPVGSPERRGVSFSVM